MLQHFLKAEAYQTQIIESFNYFSLKIIPA